MKREHEKIWGNLGLMKMFTTLIVVVILQVYIPIKLVKFYTLMCAVSCTSITPP